MDTNVWLDVLSGDDSPELVSEALGLMPDEVNVRGQPRPLVATQVVAQISRRNLWRLKRRLPETARPEEHLADMRARTAAHVGAFQSLRQRGYVIQVVLVAYIPSNRQSEEWIVDEETIAWLAASGARLEVAVYPMLPEPDSEDSEMA